jgi:tetratricopeptide (TPR) repeat protein
MKRIVIGLVIGLALVEAGRHLYRAPDESASAAMAAYSAGDFTTAEARFHQAEQTAPNPASAAHNRAAALYRMGRLDDADRGYERSADDQAMHAARAAYDRGNCAFCEACKDEGTAESEALDRAAKHYEACLAHEGSGPAPGTLFEDARHNLELTRLILSEFAEAEKDPSAAERSRPDDPAQAGDDPFSPSNAAHPPERDGQPQQPGAESKADQQGEKQDGAEDQAKADAKDSQQNASENKAGGEQKEQTRECKECKKGGCPKCKKPGSKPGGPQQTQAKGASPKPSPGQSENGKSPGNAKSKQETNHPGKGEGKKPGESTAGKAGQGGKPNPNGKNGVGDAKAPGTGQVDPSERAQKKSQPSPGQAVGPDGVAYERQDKPEQGGTSGGGGKDSEEAKRAQGGGKEGKQQAAPGETRKQTEPGNQPEKDELDKLFGPGSPPRPRDGGGKGTGGADYGQGRLGTGKVGPDADEIDGSGDPQERAAARRLRQAIQRIQNSRDARPPTPGAKPGEAPGSDRRRDW